MENLVKKNEQERVGERKQTIKRKFNEEGGGGREGVVEPEGKRKTLNLQNVSDGNITIFFKRKGIKGEDGKIKIGKAAVNRVYPISKQG